MVYNVFFLWKTSIKLQYGAGCENVMVLGVCNAAPYQVDLLIIFEEKKYLIVLVWVSGPT